jgi:chromosome segregation ATPase
VSKDSTEKRLIRLEVKLETILEKLNEQGDQLRELNNSIPRLHNDISIIGADVTVLKADVRELQADTEKNTKFRRDYVTEKATNDRWIKFLGIGSIGGIVSLVLGIIALIREFFIHGQN